MMKNCKTEVDCKLVGYSRLTVEDIWKFPSLKKKKILYLMGENTLTKWQDFMSNASINHLINERSGKVFLGTSLVEVTKFYTNIDGALIFVDRDRFGDP
jgi:hypothetical protein